MTTQHINTKTNIHVSSGIPTHDPKNKAAETYAVDRAATGTGSCKLKLKLSHYTPWRRLG
jgi:hypothetical protein